MNSPPSHKKKKLGWHPIELIDFLKYLNYIYLNLKTQVSKHI
jgi:hypothetical protein